MPEDSRPEILHDQLIYLGDAERLRLRDIPELALRWLELITEMGGLPEAARPRGVGTGSQLGRVNEDPVKNTRLKATRSAVLDNGQEIVLREAEHRSANGSRTIEVLDKPGRTDVAIIAMLTVLEGRSISSERVPQVFGKSGGISHEEYDDLVGSALFATSLLRYCRPAFDELPQEEQLALIESTCARINDLLEASRKLVNHLEYRAPARDLRSAVENASIDVNAPVLRDVDGMTYPEIAEQLDISVSPSARAVDDYSKIYKMVARGRDILERAWGKDGWKEKTEAMKAEAARWYSLAPKDRIVDPIFGEFHF